jgi:lipopolysaccharide export LptBFGC system permease protein LptF
VIFESCTITDYGEGEKGKELEIFAPEFRFTFRAPGRSIQPERALYRDFGELWVLMQERDKSGREARLEFHRRLARSLLPAWLILLAASLGIFVRKASRLAGLGASIPPLVGTLILVILADGLASREELRVDPRVCAYGPVALLGAASLWVSFKVRL